MVGSSQVQWPWRTWMETKASTGSRRAISSRADSSTCQEWQAWQRRVSIVDKPLDQLWAIQQNKCSQQIRSTLLISCNPKHRYLLKDQLAEATTTKCHRRQPTVRIWKRSEALPIKLALSKMQWAWNLTRNPVSSSWNHRTLRRRASRAARSTRPFRTSRRTTVNWTFARIPLTRSQTFIAKTLIRTILCRAIHKGPAKSIKPEVLLFRHRILKAMRSR